MKRLLRQMLVGLLSIILLCSAAAPAMAIDQPTLRVAFYPLNGFFEYDANGMETGYGVELLNRITTCTGIHFTYVKADSWENTKYMLLNGQADIRMPGTMPTVPSSTLGYTQHNILDTYYAVLTLKSRSDLVYDDFDTFKKLKIAISSNLYNTSPTKNYLSKMNLSEDNLVFYREYNDCRAALQDGTVDALISNIMDLDEEMKLISRFASRSNYISMTVGNPYLDMLDDALFQIKLEDATFFPDLYRKWFPERANIPYTKEELAYLATMDHLRFYFNEGQGYLSHREKDGSFAGFYPTLAKGLCSELGVAYEEYSGKIRWDGDTTIVPDFYYDFDWANTQNAAITEPYTTASYYEVSQKNKTVDRTKARVAAVKEYRVTQDCVTDHYREDQIVWCKNYAECMEAVYTGKVSLAYVNRYTAEYYLNFYRYNNLTATLTGYTHQVCFAVLGGDQELVASIINKRLASLSADQLNTMMIEVTSIKPPQHLFTEWFYQNPPRSVLVVTLIGVTVALMLAFVVAAQKTRRQNAALLKATHAKQDFLSRMSHDMRTPMNAIVGFSAFGVDSETLPEARAYHQKIHDASQYLLQLINDTLDLSKMEAGTLKLHMEAYQSAEFIETISNILGPKAAEKGVHFTIDNEISNPSAAMFDKLRLQQVFINLLNNAIKFTPPGGHVTFKIAAATGEDQQLIIVFSVIDDGVGMTETFQREQLYKPFVQERRVENAESGTGLGLSIVKELVTAMGGTIRCESAPGKGTTFTVVLRTQVADAPAAHPAAALQEGALSGKTILLCEDHPLNREIADKLLQKAGAAVVNAENGQIGLETFQASAIGGFDAILMDIRMPVMNGLAAARAIRRLNRPDGKTIPIIAMTANAFDEDVQESMEAGINAHLAKPIDPPQLYAVLAQLIHHSDE